jgi:Response regulator receiver domain
MKRSLDAIITEAADAEEVSVPAQSGSNDGIETSPSTSLKQIRVVVADDHPVARQGLSEILGSMDDVKVVAEAADGEEACKLYYEYSPDVLMVDLRMPKKDGVTGGRRTDVGLPSKTTPGDESWSKRVPWSKSQITSRSKKRFAQLPPAAACFRQPSLSSSRKQLRTRSSVNVKLKFCSG